jgi:LuxR family transcriptional regulator, maltose regulon positive regulatory protein
VTSGLRKGGEPGLELGQLLLDAKFSIPRPPAGALSRAKLIHAARSSACRVVGVTAPAGCGKSTFLAEWVDAEARRVAWVSLDRFDDNPAVLLALLASALRVSPVPFVLMLDDLHEPQSPDCHDVRA